MKTIFLDLEETIIESVDNPKILFEQVAKIKQFISLDDKIVLFSFALWEQSDLTEIIQKIVLESFGQFDVVFKNDLKPLFRKSFGIKDDLDFMDFSNNKQTVFLLWIIEEIITGKIQSDCIFFDDMISDLDLTIAGIKVSLKNAKGL